MNRRIKKKRKKYRYLCCGKYIYIKPREWNKVKNQSRQTQIDFIIKKMK